MENCYSALELRTLSGGGYVVFSALYGQGEYREPVAAFSTLDGALAWIKAHQLAKDL